MLWGLSLDTSPFSMDTVVIAHGAVVVTCSSPVFLVAEPSESSLPFDHAVSLSRSALL